MHWSLVESWFRFFILKFQVSGFHEPVLKKTPSKKPEKNLNISCHGGCLPIKNEQPEKSMKIQPTKTLALSLAIGASLSLGALSASAESVISWGSAQNVTGASDVATKATNDPTHGTYFDAVTFDGVQSVSTPFTNNGIVFNTFNGYYSGNTSYLFNDGGQSNNIRYTPGVSNPVVYPGSVPGELTWKGNGSGVVNWVQTQFTTPLTTNPYLLTVSGNAAYGDYYGVNSIDNGGWDSQFGHGPYGTIDLLGLTVGKVYQVQIWSGSWNNNYRTATFGTSTNNSNNVTLAYGDAGATLAATAASSGQYVIGQFTANASEEDIFDSSLSPSAISLLTVPEPSTYALFGLGALALVFAYRSKSRRTA
jgi:hypothetical protein